MAASVFGLLVSVGLAALPTPNAGAATGINKQINFQGKVVNGNGTNVANGSYTFVFSLYSVSSGGSNIWTETKSLTVTDGVFQTNLGSSTSLPGSVDFNTDNIYLGINFNADGEMLPRIQFTAAAYAFNSDKLQGLSASAFAQLSPGSAQSGSLNVTGSVQAGTSLQAPLVDAATAVALNIGTGTASSVTIGKTTTPFLIQGNSSSTFTATSGANTTTVSFTAPTAPRAINFPDAGGTLCTNTASTCSATYQVAGSYLAKGATDTSSFAVTATNYLYGFTNSSSAVASGVLKLDNGNNTGSGLTVVGSGNPAAGQALILANAATGVTGNLLDLQVNAASKFSVNQAGAVTTASTINSQTISSAASFTGTVTAATSLLAPLVDTASAGTLNVATATATGLTLGKSSFQVSIPGGLTTNGNGIVTANGTINAGSGTISTTGALNGGTSTLASSGAAAIPVLNFTGTPLGGVAAAATTSLVQFGSAIAAGNQAANGGTYLGLNLPAAGAGSAADFLNFQKNGTVEFKVDNSGNGTLGGGLTVGTGAVAAFSSAGLFQNAAVDSSVTYSNLQKVGTINTGTWQGTPVGVLYGGTGQTTYTDGQLLIGNTTGNTLTKATLTGTANRLSITNGSGAITLNVDATQFPNSAGANTILKSSGANAASWVANTQTNVCSDCAVTTLNNVGSTSIPAALIASANNAQNLGSTANVWQNVYTGNIDAGATTTTLAVGATATSLTLGKAGVVASIPGGLTTNGSAIATANGNLTLGSGTINTTGTITSGLINGQTISSAANFTGTLTAATSLLSPLMDTATAVALQVGTGTASSVTVGKTTTNFTLQGAAGSGASKITGTSGAFATTLDFATAASSVTVHVPNEAGTLCIQSSINCGFLVGAAGSYIINQTSQQASSNFNISATGIAGVSLIAPLYATADVASGTSNNVTVRSGNATAGNGSAGNVTLDSGSKNGSGFNGNVYVGNTNALNVNICHNAATASGTAVSIQGLAATSSLIMNDATNTYQTTIGFNAPTANRSILFPDAGGTLCTNTASTCNTTYQPYSANGYLARNGNDTSSASYAGNLYAFTNSNSGASGVLALSGAGTNSALSVTNSGNAGANQAVILATNSNGTPTGNLIDLRVTAGSRFSVDTAGAVTTSSTINGQTISSSASFTGTVTSATGITATSGGITVTGTGTFNNAVNITGLTTTTGGITNNSAGIAAAGAISGATTVTASGTIQGGGTFKTADTAVASTASAGVTVTSGNASGTGGASGSGAVAVDSGTSTNGTTGAINIATANASAVTIGRTGTGAPTVAVQGGTGSTIQISNGATNYSLIQFTAPTAQVTYTLGTNGSNTSANICTSLAASCNTTYQPYIASGYLVKSPTSNEASSSNFTGYQYTFTQNSGTAAGNLSLSNSGTNSALLVTAASNPTAGQALVAVNNTNGAPSGNLLDLQKAGTSQFAIDFGGNVTTLAGASTGKFNSQTISSTANFTGTVTSASAITISAGGLQATGNSNITGTLGVTSALTVSAGGASITGGINNNAGGITSAGAVSGLTSLQYNTDGTLDTAGANSITVGGVNANALAIGRTGVTTTVNGTTQVGAAAGTGALLNNGTTVNTTYNMANLPGGGWDAGGAAATVDKYTYIAATQTSASQTLTIPTPTANTTYGRLLYLTNIGTASFTLLTTTIGAGSTATLIWANTNGAASWTFAGADGSGILNQSAADQTANFRITGTGRANTSVTSPLFDSISGALNVGTTTATGITIGGAATTGTIAIGTAAASTLNLGTGAFAHTIAVGTDATTVQGITIGSTNTTSATTLQAGSGAINLNAATIATNQATVALFNATATTVNEFGAATAINVGAASTVVTYGNGGAATLRSTTAGLTITSAAGATWQATTGNLTVQSAAASSTLGLDTGSGGTIAIGTSNVAHTITVGNQGATGTQAVTIGSSGNAANTAAIESGTTAGGGSIAIGNGNTTHTINVGTASGSAQTVTIGSTNASSTNLFQTGATRISMATGGATVQTTTNSTTAFNVQNSSGFQIFNTDTTTVNLITNPSFEVDTTGAIAKGAAGAPTRVTTQKNHGIASISEVTTAAAGDGIRINNFTQVVAAGTYTFSFSARLGSGSWLGANIRVGYNAGSDTPTCTYTTGTQNASTGGWRTYTCTFTSGANLSSLYIEQLDATARTIYVDGMQLESGSIATAFMVGRVSIRGVVDSPLAIKTVEDSTAAFTIQNASGSTTLVQADTLNGVLKVGTIATPTLAQTVLYASYGEIANTLRVGDATNGFDFDKTTGPNYFGTARPSKRITFTPEYAGAVMTGSGSSNTGTMTSDFCSASARLNILAASYCQNAGEEHNFYNWVSALGTTQTYDVYIKYQMPSDFSAFDASNVINMYGWRKSTNDKVEISFFQTNNTQCGTTTNVATTNNTWTETTMAGTITSCSIAAGDVVTFRIRLTSTASGNNALAGEIRFNYLAKF